MDGKATFKARDWLTTDTRSTVIQGYLGYTDVPNGFQGAHVIGLTADWNLEQVFNLVNFERVGGVMQSVSDLPSIAANGGTPRTYTRTDLQNSTDGEVLTLALGYLAAHKDLRFDVSSVSIAAVADPANADLNRLLWTTDYGDLLSILVQTGPGWTLEREAHVFGISHSITAADWVATFRLDDAQVPLFDYWILEDSEFGVLNQTTRLA